MDTYEKGSMRSAAFFCLCLLPINLVPQMIYFLESGVCYSEAYFYGKHDYWRLRWHDLKDTCAHYGYYLTSNIFAYAQEPSAVICWGVPSTLEEWKLVRNTNMHPKVLVIYEPATVDHTKHYNLKNHTHFDVIFTMLDDFVDGHRYRKFYYPLFLYDEGLSVGDAIIPFDDRKLCTIICSNIFSKDPRSLYQYRFDAVQWFEKNAPQDLDFYGLGWPQNVSLLYRGDTKDKIQCMKKYKFAICFENSSFDGYISEKIFHCFQAGCVPVYWGPPNIEKYIPKNCFIDFRDFSSFDELYQYLISVDEKIFNDYLDNIRAWFKTPMAYNFSFEHFIDLVMCWANRDFDGRQTVQVRKKQLSRDVISSRKKS